MHGKPVTIRTFDLGADKQIWGSDGLVRVAPNPALGLRAIRFCLAEPRLFLTQLRAILRASHHGNVRILIPMLASASEINQTLDMIAQAKETLREQGVPFDSGIKVGGMIEIPAAALAISSFLAKLDFLSIGTNDLIQYTLAIDRADDAVSHLYDPLHPAVLKLLAMSIDAANRAKVPIAVCGEMAGEVALTRLLLGLGPAQPVDASGASALGQAARATTEVARAKPRGRPHAPPGRSGEARGAARQAQRLKRLPRPRNAGQSNVFAVAGRALAHARAPCNNDIVMSIPIRLRARLRACIGVLRGGRIRRCDGPVGSRGRVRSAGAGVRAAGRQRARSSRWKSCAGASSTSISGRRGAARAGNRSRG